MSDPLICNVCNKHEALGVASSGLGPVSFAFCRECLTHHAEPEFMLQYVFDETGGQLELPAFYAGISTYKDGSYIPYEEWARTAELSPPLEHEL